MAEHPTRLLSPPTCWRDPSFVRLLPYREWQCAEMPFTLNELELSDLFDIRATGQRFLPLSTDTVVTREVERVDLGPLDLFL